MKKQWLPLVFAVFLMLAPVASADDGSASGWLEGLVDQIVALLVGDEIGPWYPPDGATVNGDEKELGLLYPPNGAHVTDGEQQLGPYYPPHG